MIPDPSQELPVELPTATRRVGAAKLGKLIASCVFGALLLYALRRGGVPLLPTAKAFARVRWWTLPAYIGLIAVSSYFRGVRWRLLLRPVAEVSSGRALSAVLVGSAAVLLLPLRLGEMARPYLIARDKRVGVLAALATVVAERIIDGLVLSLILGAALVLVPSVMPSSTRIVGLSVPVSVVRGYAWSFLITFSVAFIVIVIFHAARSLGIRVTQSVFGRVSPRLGSFVALRLESFANGLDFLKHHTLAAQFLFETLLYWGVAALSYWFLGWGTGVVHLDGSGMSFGEACAIMGVLGIATVLPGPPGLLGLFQVGVYAALTMYFPENVITGAGSAYVFLLYVLQMGFAIVSAGACLAISAWWPEHLN